VKIVIQDIRTRQFVSGKGQRTGNVAEAEDLITANHAIYVARSESLAQFNIVLYSPSFNFSLSVIRSSELPDVQPANAAPARPTITRCAVAVPELDLAREHEAVMAEAGAVI
jgi:hypothetical protein